jgi:ATP-binding cassette subfamily C protein LapB
MTLPTDPQSTERADLQAAPGTIVRMRPEGAPADAEAVPEERPDSADRALVRTVQRLLRINGLHYSEAAIRELPDLSSEAGFGVREAVSALSHCGFSAAFGALARRDLRPAHCPFIALGSDGAAAIVTAIPNAANVEIARAETDFLPETIPMDQFRRSFGEHLILARKRHASEAEKDGGHWFWGSLRRGRWLYVQVLVAAAVTNILGLSSSLFIMVVYDRVVPNEAIESLIALTVGVLIALGFEFILKTLRASFIDRAGKRADARMSRLVFDKILSMPLDKRRNSSGAMASVVREFDTLREFFTSATLVAVVDLPFIFFFVWVISLIAGPLYLVPLLCVPIVMFAGLVIQPFLARIAAASMDTAMSKQSVLVETLNGLETVQATGSGRLMRRRFEEASDSQSDLGLRSRLLSQFAINAATSVQQLAQIAIIFYGVFLIQDGAITMGAMIAAVILSGKTLAPLSQLAQALTRTNSARQAYRTLDKLMRPEDDGTGAETGQRVSRPRLRGDIEFQGVSYTFPGARQPIISNLSIKIPAGQKVALLGRMGSGKSTLTRLAAGLIQPTEGAIRIDGVDLRQIDRADLRRNMGVMLQDAWLFSGTLRDNILMGNHEYDDQHLLDLGRITGVDGFVSKHPAGYDLTVRERGEGLSGGQRQSINLARALLHDPGILVLDEPTAAMDTGTEKHVLDQLSGWLRGRTMIVVTHRNSILRLVDRVLVVEGGAVVTDTTPDRLQAASR